jgi:predicted Na+-dependent transporter
MTDDGAAALKRTTGRDIARVVLGAALILLVPLVAMQFTTEVAWGLLDFAVAGALLVGTGTLYVILANRLSQKRQRLVIGLVLAVALILVWMELAVGIFGSPFAGS